MGILTIFILLTLVTSWGSLREGLLSGVSKYEGMTVREWYMWASSISADYQQLELEYEDFKDCVIENDTIEIHQGIFGVGVFDYCR